MKLHHLLLASVLSLNTTAALAQHAHDHAPGSDNRVVLALTPDERVMILEEMRLFLDGVQKMTGALGKQAMPAVAEAARGMGRKLAHEVPPALRAKLPLEFRQLGASVHGDFDQIALDAESLKDVSYSLSQLSATLQKCVSCHTMYQIQGPALDARH
ncbi:MAG TPA: hypothetical protein PKV42_11060 [Thiobacillus sp.]|nr:MAG: hypothetical protein B7Y27_01035 [Hydrogenophilales bacterium 16-64-40]OZA35319.1 MAG: hypothetical protein B7X82_02385 [Hydrogenophilales bacterium 17-64-65]HQS82985.1 hypothetical protein [Thiobacillus sp.]HQT33704.1 hypothetical protein [Thiobacillus sp.]